MKKIALAAVAALGILSSTLTAQGFELSFKWGNLKLCNTGKPNTVANPVFKLSGVPAGTIELRFKMIDRQVPDYNHGGGKVAYSGASTVESGAFKYKSPCPPDGAHPYQWTVTAIGAAGKKLGTAQAVRNYPE